MALIHPVYLGSDAQHAPSVFAKFLGAYYDKVCGESRKTNKVGAELWNTLMVQMGLLTRDPARGIVKTDPHWGTLVLDDSPITTAAVNVSKNDLRTYVTPINFYSPAQVELIAETWNMMTDVVDVQAGWLQWAEVYRALKKRN